MEEVCQPQFKQKEKRQMDENRLSQTTWNYKYHIVLAPKYRRQIIYGKIKAEISQRYQGATVPLRPEGDIQTGLVLFPAGSTDFVFPGIVH